MKNQIYKKVANNLLILIVSIALTRITQGFWIGIMTVLGTVWAISSKVGKALSMYFMIVFMVGLNPFLLPSSSVFGYLVRLGPLIIGLALMLKGVSLKGQSRVPLGMLTIYLAVAAISSIDGWAPGVSYLKIINFLVFMLGFWFGLHTLGYDREGIIYLRATFLAFSMFLIIGSLLLLPFPGISTLSGLQLALIEGNVEAANAAMLSQEGSLSLFCGVTRQSQFFAPLCACAISWLLADMLFVEQRFTRQHLVAIAIGVPLLYLSRSRTGLVTLMVGVIVVAVFLPRKMALPLLIKRRLKTGVAALLLLSTLVGVWTEITKGSISQWIRKTDSIENDTRSLSEAVTHSRQKLVDESMFDYHRNPFWGSGFQVSEGVAEMVAKNRSSLVISASIEKGVLPIMILGETGIVGAVAFVIFLMSFYFTSSRRRLYVTAALFTVMLASNMGEATFFSPGGLGGLLWAISIIGGYCIDMTLAKQLRQMPREMSDQYPAY